MMEDFISMIQSVGFPIVTCGICFWYIKDLSANMMSAIQNNTLALTKLELKLDQLEGGVIGHGSEEQRGAD